MLIAIAFYDAGYAFESGDARASVISVISFGSVISVLMHISGLNYVDLFHP